VNVLTRTSVCTEPFSFPLANDFLNLRLILYELKSSKGKGFNDEDVNILTETSVYSEPFQFCPTINLLNLHVITFEFYHSAQNTGFVTELIHLHRMYKNFTSIGPEKN
jgi:hypothetical protein